MKLVHKINQLHYVLQAKKVYFCDRRQIFHSSNLFRNFAEKPEWLQKFKVKQAAMQRNDGVPVYLKNGLPDKILFNITFFGVIGGFFWSMYTIYQLSKK